MFQIKAFFTNFFICCVSISPLPSLGWGSSEVDIWSVVSTVLSTPVSAKSDFEALQSTAPCTWKSVGDPGDRNNFVSNFYSTQSPKIVTTQTLQPPSVSTSNHIGTDITQSLYIPRFGIYKHSPHCEKNVIFIRSHSLTLYASSNNFQLRSLLQFPFNTNPQLVHHIFIGLEGMVRSLFEQEDIKLLLFKTGIAITKEIAETPRILQQRHFPPTMVQYSTDQYLKRQMGRFDILSNRHFVVFSWPLKIHVVRDENGQPIGGMGYNFIKTFTTYYNSTFDFLHKKGGNSRQMANGSWHGALGALANGEADIVSWMGNTEARNPYAEFPTYHATLSFTFFTSLPKAMARWYGMIFVFSEDVWMYIFLSLVLVVPLFYFKLGFQNMPNDNNAMTTMYISFALPTTALLQTSVKIPGKVPWLCGLFVFYSIVIGTCFNCNLISFLTIPEYEQVPETAEELFEMNDHEIRYLHFQGFACDLLFSRTANPMYLGIKKRMRYLPPSVMTTSMMETALTSKSVQLHYDLLGRIDVAQNLTLHPSFTPVRMARTPIFDLPVSFTLRKYSKLAEYITFNVGKLQNTGHFHKWFDETLDIARSKGIAWLKKLKAEGKKEDMGYHIVKLTEEALRSDTKSLTLLQFGLMFYCWIAGVCLSAICFTVEVFLEFTLNRICKIIHLNMSDIPKKLKTLLEM